MYCLNCHYSLGELNAQRCPECGRSFDPEDERTYSKVAKQDQRRAALVNGAGTLAIATLPALFITTLVGPLLLIAFLFFEIPAALVGLPIRFFVRGPVRWSAWDGAIFLWPFCTYLLGASLTAHKGYGNLFVDSMILAIIVPAYYLARARLPGRSEPVWHVPFLQAIACLAGFIVGIAVPELGSRC